MTPGPRLARRLGTCPRCGDDVILQPGIKHGKPVQLVYNADGSRLHKFSCTSTASMKHCPRCGETKPALEFVLNRAHKAGLNPWCKLCRKVYDYQHEKVTP